MATKKIHVSYPHENTWVIKKNGPIVDYSYSAYNE